MKMLLSRVFLCFSFGLVTFSGLNCGVALVLGGDAEIRAARSVWDVGYRLTSYELYPDTSLHRPPPRHRGSGVQWAALLPTRQATLAALMDSRIASRCGFVTGLSPRSLLFRVALHPWAEHPPFRVSFEYI